MDVSDRRHAGDRARFGDPCPPARESCLLRRGSAPKISRGWPGNSTPKPPQPACRIPGFGGSCPTPMCCMLSLVFSGSVGVGQALSLWQPQMIKEFGLTNIQVGFTNAVPYRTCRRRHAGLGPTLRPFARTPVAHDSADGTFGCRACLRALRSRTVVVGCRAVPDPDRRLRDEGAVSGNDFGVARGTGGCGWICASQCAGQCRGVSDEYVHWHDSRVQPAASSWRCCR